MMIARTVPTPMYMRAPLRDGEDTAAPLAASSIWLRFSRKCIAFHAEGRVFEKKIPIRTERAFRQHGVEDSVRRAAPVLDRLGEMRRFDRVGACQVGDRA